MQSSKKKSPHVGNTFCFESRQVGAGDKTPAPVISTVSASSPDNDGEEMSEFSLHRPSWVQKNTASANNDEYCQHHLWPVWALELSIGSDSH